MQRASRYEGTKLILEKRICICKNCQVVEFTPTGPRCVNCRCLIKIELTDRIEEPNPIWINPKTGRPVRRDAIKEPLTLRRSKGPEYDENRQRFQRG